jgi:type IV secretory pathway protease TraF
VETRDGIHGLTVWAVAVVLGAIVVAFVAAAAVNRPSPATAANASAAEPILSYELDRLFRSPRRPPNVDLRSERAEAGRILLTSSGHDGVSADDRTYLVQVVAAATGLAVADAERRVDNGIANARTALNRSRRSTIILAFSLATALLLGAVAAWAAACAGGRHRDGAPLPEWMAHSDRLARRRIVIQ